MVTNKSLKIFLALFKSLVDESAKASNFEKGTTATMPDRRCVGSHPRSGVSTPEYEEAKEILITKYGSARRLLLAYMDQLEQIPLIRSNDIHALEKFADLVRITVVKLQAEGKDGELGDGTLYNGKEVA